MSHCHHENALREDAVHDLVGEAIEENTPGAVMMLRPPGRGFYDDGERKLQLASERRGCLGTPLTVPVRRFECLRSCGREDLKGQVCH
jgi:hypothetical protein